MGYKYKHMKKTKEELVKECYECKDCETLEQHIKFCLKKHEIHKSKNN